MFWYEPSYTITKTETGHTVDFELPGCSDLDVSVEAGTLRISGKKKRGDVKMDFTIPRDVDFAAVEAEYRDGILSITLPIAAASRRRSIPIKTSSSESDPTP